MDLQPQPNGEFPAIDLFFGNMNIKSDGLIKIEKIIPYLRNPTPFVSSGRHIGGPHFSNLSA
jgi:hypothetical protein